MDMGTDADAFISQRARGVDASGVRRVFDLAAKLRDPINLSIGLPDFDVPDAVKDAACDAIRRGENKYTPTQGIAPLRERIAAEHGRTGVEDVLITSGVSGGLMLAILATVDPGDEVLFLDPYFVMYRHLVTMAGGVSVAVDSYPDFRLDPATLERAITSRTKVLILNSPANPTGVCMTPDEVRAAADVAGRHGLLVVSDEIYVPFLHDDATPAGIEHLYENTLLLRGFSKTYGMTGWRMGYAVGPRAVVSQMAKLQQYTFVCAPTPFQHASLAAMDLDPGVVGGHVEAYRHKRDIVLTELGSAFEVARPTGAFYAFPRVPGHLNMTGTQFCERMLADNVLIIPGCVFSGRDTHVRLSYGLHDEALRQGCRLLCRAAEAG